MRNRLHTNFNIDRLMFIMTSDIRIWRFEDIKPNAVKWKCSVSNFVDTCTITLPLHPYVRNNVTNPTEFSKQAASNNVAIREGDPVTVNLGYDHNNTLRFKGFINRINQGDNLVLECEGYSYQLKNTIFNKTYSKTSFKKILQDLTNGTDIKLSKYIPDVTLTNVTFKNVPGLKMLEWFQKECLATVCFYFDELYVGQSKYAVPRPTQKLRIGWNIADDKSLKKDNSDVKIQINIIEKNSEGTVKRTKSEQRKYSAVKEVKVRAGLPLDYLKDVANELQKEENFKGYQGNIDCFLVPHFEKGYVAELTSGLYPEKNGKYFVESIDGKFDQNNDYQTLTLRYYGNVDGTGN